MGSVVVIAVMTSAFGLLAQGLSGALLFFVALLGALTGPAIVWCSIFIYRVIKPMRRFSVGVGNIGPLGATSGGNEEVFGIETVTDQCAKGVGELELRAALPDGTFHGWEKIDYQTFCGGKNIFFMKYPSAWPSPEGRYELSWRGTSWGYPAQIVAKGSFIYSAGSWQDTP
ncbi:MAG: hypothetical protein ACRESI_08765 [Gammaproteobacteria bacterium]